MNTSLEKRSGVIYAVSAYGWWGVAPFYFKAVAHVPAVEVLAHRILWSFLLLLGIICLKGGLATFRAHFGHRKTVLTMAVTTVLIAVNWLVFIWAVANGRLVEASLGYFMGPLANVALGAVILRERLRRWQGIAVLLVLGGICYRTVVYGQLPAISVTLAISFALYGLLRKQARPDGIQGLAMETLLLLPLAVAWVAVTRARGELLFLNLDLRTDLLLAAAGFVTMMPLIWFAEAARRLRLITLGFLQYLAPSLQLLLAVAAFGEPFTREHAVSFGLIWAALGIYTWDMIRSLREQSSSKST